MTQNDIAYYNARKEAKDARLRRRETKRHNLASEATERTKAAASSLSAQASMLGSQAAAQNAETNRLNYDLTYAGEYGYQPSEFVDGFWFYDPKTNTKFDPGDYPGQDPEPFYQEWIKGKDPYIIIETPKDSKTGGRSPVSYVGKLVKVGEQYQNIETGVSKETEGFLKSFELGANTVQILVDTASNILFGKDERNKKGGTK